MMPDSACVTHTTGGNDYLWFGIIINRFGIFQRDCQLNTVKPNRINTSIEQVHSGFIEIVFVALQKYAGCFCCKRAVNKNLEAIMSMNPVLFFDFSNCIQNLLRTSDSKRGDNQSSATVESLLYDEGKFCYSVFRIYGMVMESVTVSGFHNNIICISYRGRFPYNWVPDVAYIAAEHNLLFCISLSQPKLDTGRTEQVPCINKTHIHTVIYCFSFSIVKRTK